MTYVLNSFIHLKLHNYTTTQRNQYDGVKKTQYSDMNLIKIELLQVSALTLLYWQKNLSLLRWSFKFGRFQAAHCDSLL